MDANTPQIEAALAPFLQAQRWFGGKARGLKTVRIVDWAPFPADGVTAILAFVEVELGDGKTELYFAPITITEKDGETVVHDALAEEAVRAFWLEAIAGEKELATNMGRIRAFQTTAFAEVRGRVKETPPAVLAAPTSSNSLIKYGKRLVLKLFRRPEPGVNPDLEIGRFLTDKSSFENIPRMAGGVEYLRPGSAPMTLAILQEQVAHQADGWTYTLEEVGRFYERAAGSLECLTVEKAAEVVGEYLGDAVMLASRTAELHGALSDDHGESAFVAEPLTAADLEALAADSREQVRLALAALRGGKSDNPSLFQKGGETPPLHAETAVGAGFPRPFETDIQPQEIEKLLESLVIEPPLLGSPAIALGKIRCHGDYHLGQVLWTDGDFMILDFEGEPTRTLEERRAKQSPLKDVAGMLRSFDYALHAGLFAYTENRPDDFTRLAFWTDVWQTLVSINFLWMYKQVARQSAFLPDNEKEFSALLDAFVLNKALYELVYELNNRPDWVRIPLQGISTLAARERRRAGQAPTKG